MPARERVDRAGLSQFGPQPQHRQSRFRLILGPVFLVRDAVRELRHDVPRASATIADKTMAKTSSGSDMARRPVRFWTLTDAECVTSALIDAMRTHLEMHPDLEFGIWNLRFEARNGESRN